MPFTHEQNERFKAKMRELWLEINAHEVKDQTMVWFEGKINGIINRVKKYNGQAAIISPFDISRSTHLSLVRSAYFNKGDTMLYKDICIALAFTYKVSVSTVKRSEKGLLHTLIKLGIIERSEDKKVFKLDGKEKKAYTYRFVDEEK